MSDLVPVKRALISVFDKTGLADFAKALHREFGIELISTGGTAKFLRDLGLPVTDVSQVTGFPEMMDGRVKTLHPKIHGGLLAIRDNAEHLAAMSAHGIQPIDLVCINLYPFQQTISKPGVTFEEAIENIDIGGPSMIRSAAKNHRFVIVVTSNDRYEKVLGDLREHAGKTCGKHRLKQAQRAFALTADYDGRIAGYLSDQLVEQLPPASTGGGPARFKLAPLSGAVATAAPAKGPPLHAGSSDTVKSWTALANRMAIAVKGVEAAVFRVTHSEGIALLGPITHLRPDDSDDSVRRVALEAFHDIILPCFRQNRDGAIDVGAPDGGASQYCLVVLLRDTGSIVAAIAVIVWAADIDAARRSLKLMQAIAQDSELNKFALFPAAEAALQTELHIDIHKKQELRYGENPHQKAALYVGEKPAEASVAFAKQLYGKELSYINLLDADAALSAVKELTVPTACVVKHATPCGYATGTDMATAFTRAFEGDPLASFGGIVALNRPVDLACAQAITSINKLLEVIVAPSYEPDALQLLKDRWKNVRLLEVGPLATPEQADRNELMLHKIVGGYLVQERDLTAMPELKIVSKRPPTDQEMSDLQLAWVACKHVKSNAIVIGKGDMVVGIGGGQVDRVNAARIAIQKAGERAKGAVAASDAFFPFPDGPELLLDAGITAIIHPGGSVKDQETLDLVDRRGASLVLTGQRHFRH